MSKKWITYLVAAAVGAVLLVPSAAMAQTCQASLIGRLSWTGSNAGHDATAVAPGQTTTALADYTGNGGNDIAAITAGTGAQIAAEGLGERIADLLIYDPTDNSAGTNQCLIKNAIITITVNGVLVGTGAPLAGSSINNSTYLDVFDSAGANGVTVASANVTQGFAANQPTTIITITLGATNNGSKVTTAATNVYGFSGLTGSAIRLKNLRVDATSILTGTNLPGGASINIGAGPVPFFGFSIGAAAVGGTATANANILATVHNSNGTLVYNGDPTVTTVANGFENANAGLVASTVPQKIGWTPNLNIGTYGGDGATYRQAGNAPSLVANDAKIGSTDVLFHVFGIPTGTDVSFPARMNVVTNNGNTITTFLLSNSTLDNGNGANAGLNVLYNTVTNSVAAGVQGKAFAVETADNADPGSFTGKNGTSPDCTSAGKNLNKWSLCDGNPKVRVFTNANGLPGTAGIDILMGPAGTDYTNTSTAAVFANGDADFDASGSYPYPRYGCTFGAGGTPVNLGTASCANGGNRFIVANTNFFTILPNRTALLYPYVSTRGNFDAGVEVGNICNDTAAFVGTSGCPVTIPGQVVFYFFGTTADAARTAVVDKLDTSATDTVAAGACQGFGAAGSTVGQGKLAAGAVGSCVLSKMLPLLASKPASFEGYIIAVSRFVQAHGVYAFFNASGSPFAYNGALVLGAGSRGGVFNFVGSEPLGQ